MIYQRCLHALALGVTLFGVWYVFSGYAKPFLLVGGAISVLLSVVTFYRMKLASGAGVPLYFKPQTYLYIVWLAKQIWDSAVNVSRIIWKVSPDIAPAMRWVDAHKKPDIGKALYANSITLTPGTLCMDVDHSRVLVHALDPEGIKDLENGAMDLRVVKVTGEI